MANPDKDFLNRRNEYAERAREVAAEVIREDGYMQDAFSTFTGRQRGVLLEVIGHQLAVRRFGRLEREEPHTRVYPGGTTRHIDPIAERYASKLRRVGGKWDESHMGIIVNSSQLVEIAARNDYDLRQRLNPPSPTSNSSTPAG